MNRTPRLGPTPVGQRLRAQTIPGRRAPGPGFDEWDFSDDDDVEVVVTTTRR